MSDPMGDQEALLERVAAFLGLFGALAQRFQLYGRGHPRTEETWTEFEAARDELLRALPGGRGQLAIAFHEDRFYFENVPLPKNRQQAHALRAHLTANELGGFILALTLPDADLERVLAHVARSAPDEDAVELPEGFHWVAREEVHRLQGDTESARESVRTLLDSGDSPLDEPTYNAALDALSMFLDELAAGHTANVTPLREISESLAHKMLERPQELLPRATIPYYAEFSVYHGVHACLLALAAARLLTESPEQLARVALAALLHDCGLALVPQELLYKDGSLTGEELAALMAHTTRGADALEHTPGAPALAVAVAYGHHLKPPGRGYPQVSGCHEPGPVTRLVAVVDALEALTAFRPHKRAITHPQAFVRLAGEPALAKLRPWISLLAHAIGFHPAGSRVILPDGRIAVVCGHDSADPLRPVIRLVEFTPEGVQTLPERYTTYAGDVPWFDPPDGAATVTALDPLVDLDLLARPPLAPLTE